MHILIVASIFPPDIGGPASYVPQIGKWLCSQGHSIEVIALSDTPLYNDAQFPFPVLRVSRRLPISVRVAKKTRLVYQKAKRANVVYGNGLGVEAALGAALARCPLVMKVVGDYSWERASVKGQYLDTLDAYQVAKKGLLFQARDKTRNFALNQAASVITPSQYLKKIVAGWGVEPAKIRVVYNAIHQKEDIDRSHVLPEWDGYTILVVCRLVPWKKVDAIIRTLPKLEKARLVVVGDGPLRDDLIGEARSLKVDSRVLFMGRRTKAEVNFLFEQADAFVLNSTYEGLPHVVLEAMQKEVPVVATEAGGTPEVVKDGSTGRLVEVGNENELLNSLKAVFEEPYKTTQMVKAAYDKVTTIFSWEKMVTNTESVLRAAARAKL